MIEKKTCVWDSVKISVKLSAKKTIVGPAGDRLQIRTWFLPHQSFDIFLKEKIKLPDPNGLLSRIGGKK